mgnify:FL=1
MKNDNALISTAVLTAIWDDSHKDNIELVIPFVSNIIFNKFKVNDLIDEEYILRQLKEKFCFNKFPHAVLKIVLNRMKRRNILKLDNKKFILTKDLKDEAKEFEDRLNIAKLETSKVISAITKYLKKELNDDIVESDAEIYFGNFISSYGYNAYENINFVKKIERKSDVTNYLIGEFICRENEKNSDIFKLILRIIEGYMIANAIYLQIENDNKASLRKLNCYLDAAFILRVLGYKSDEENESAKELYDLLVKYGATINCFNHTFIEVRNILYYYKININKNKEMTLEYFDKEKYSEGQVDLIISSLEDIFKDKRINIVDTPDFTKDRYKDVIDVKTLEEKLTAHKEKHNQYINPNSITNDVNSVCAINMLRRGKKITKIENCTHIFVTTYQYLKSASREIMPELFDTDIGLVIDDLDLTTILWFKDFENNADLPKLRLVENALAATNASDEIMCKAAKIFESIKKDGSIRNLENVSNCLTKNYLKSSGFVDSIKNDSELVTKESLLDFLTKRDKEIESIKKELEDTKERNLKKELSIQKKFIVEAEQKAEADFNKNIKILKTVYYILFFLILALGIYAIVYSIITTGNFIIAAVLLLINIISLIDMASPRSKFILRKIDTYCKNKKRDYITKETKKIMEKYE